MRILFAAWLACLTPLVACLSSYQEDLVRMLEEAAKKTGWQTKEIEFNLERYEDATRTGLKQVLYTHVEDKNTRQFTEYFLAGISKEDRALLAPSLDLTDSTVLHSTHGVFVVHGGETNVAYLTNYLLFGSDDEPTCAGCREEKHLRHVCLKCGAQICQSCHESAVQTSAMKWKDRGPVTKAQKHLIGPACPSCGEPRSFGAIDVARILSEHDEL